MSTFLIHKNYVFEEKERVEFLKLIYKKFSDSNCIINGKTIDPINLKTAMKLKEIDVVELNHLLLKQK